MQSETSTDKANARRNSAAGKADGAELVSRAVRYCPLAAAAAVVTLTSAKLAKAADTNQQWQLCITMPH